MARPTSRKKSELSKAVVELRVLLGENQQAFSNRLGIALNTVARYETSRPPSGEMLLRLGQLAAMHHETFPQRDIFFDAYADELGKSAFELMTLPHTKNRPVLCIPRGLFEGDKQWEAAQCFMVILSVVRSGEPKSSEEALAAIRKLADKYSSPLQRGLQDTVRGAMSRGGK
jgi:transcriptional regulator with XRE-family HTH domain